MNKEMSKEMTGLIVEVSQGNPGALSFLVKLIKMDTTQGILSMALIEMLKNNGPKGSELYVIWDRQFDRNTQSTMDYLLERFVEMENDGTFKFSSDPASNSEE